MQTGEFQPAKSVIRVAPFEGHTSYARYTCTQCAEGWCMTACPVGAITINAAGAKDVLDDTCVGCKLCTVACPYGTMFYDPDTRKAFKCNLCGGAPACAEACPTAAITYEATATADWLREVARERIAAAPRVPADWGVKPHVGRRATALDTRANVCTLDDGTRLEYDDCLIATGSSAVRAPVPGADGRGVHSFWTLDEARAVLAEIAPGSHVVMVGAGFIAFTILNSILALGAKLTIVEVAPRILPRMVDDAGARLVEDWLTKHGGAIRTRAQLTRIEDAKGRKRPRFAAGGDLVCDVVILATGIKTNLGGLNGSRGTGNRGVVVDDRLRSSVPNVYAAGDIAEGRDLITGEPAVHAIEPTAQEHGRVVGANMAGKDVHYRGSLIVNLVEVCHLDVASFGAWDDAKAEIASGAKPDRPAYRQLLWRQDRPTGAIN